VNQQSHLASLGPELIVAEFRNSRLHSNRGSTDSTATKRDAGIGSRHAVKREVRETSFLYSRSGGTKRMGGMV
jgi:hypothetical protein